MPLPPPRPRPSTTAFTIKTTKPAKPQNDKSSSVSTRNSSESNSDYDDLNDLTCPFCENDHFPACLDDDDSGELLYCSKGQWVVLALTQGQLIKS